MFTLHQLVGLALRVAVIDQHQREWTVALKFQCDLFLVSLIVQLGSSLDGWLQHLPKIKLAAQHQMTWLSNKVEQSLVWCAPCQQRA